MRRTYSNRKPILIATMGFIVLSGAFISLFAQQVQIPTLQVCNQSKLGGKATVFIAARKDISHSGTFTVSGRIACSSPGYPVGNLAITGISMSDSSIQGTVTVTSLEQVTSTGKDTPTLYLNGRCKAERIEGCRFWMMVADNKNANEKVTPDIISFLVLDGKGNRMAYGTGPVMRGDMSVAPQ